LQLIFTAVEYQIVFYSGNSQSFFSILIQLIIYFAIIVPVFPPAQNHLLVWLSNNKF